MENQSFVSFCRWWKCFFSPKATCVIRKRGSQTVRRSAGHECPPGCISCAPFTLARRSQIYHVHTHTMRNYNILHRNGASWNAQTIWFYCPSIWQPDRFTKNKGRASFTDAFTLASPPSTTWNADLRRDRGWKENSLPSAKPWSSNMRDYLTTLALIQSNNGGPNWAPNHATKKTVGPLNPLSSAPVSYITFLMAQIETIPSSLSAR